MLLKNKAATIMRFIGNDELKSIESFIDNMKKRDYVTFENEEQINSYFDEYMSNYYRNCSYYDIESLRYYTGISFNQINSLLRGFWNYETNGLLTDEKRKEYMGIANDLSNALSKLPDSLPSNIKVYRGVNISSFKDYGISNINDLKNMVGQYFYDGGFTSASLLRNKSFFDRDLEWHDPCNIEIEYLIPYECSDGIALISDDLSYSKSQAEFLINKSSLSKIIDVSISEDGTKAYLKAAFIPRKIWDLEYDNHQEISR